MTTAEWSRVETQSQTRRRRRRTQAQDESDLRPQKDAVQKERRVDEQTDEMYSLMNRLCTGLTLEYTEENTISL